MQRAAVTLRRVRQPLVQLVWEPECYLLTPAFESIKVMVTNNQGARLFA